MLKLLKTLQAKYEYSTVAYIEKNKQIVYLLMKYKNVYIFLTVLEKKVYIMIVHTFFLVPVFMNSF